MATGYAPKCVNHFLESNCCFSSKHFPVGSYRRTKFLETGSGLIRDGRNDGTLAKVCCRIFSTISSTTVLQQIALSLAPLFCVLKNRHHSFLAFHSDVIKNAAVYVARTGSDFFIIRPNLNIFQSLCTHLHDTATNVSADICRCLCGSNNKKCEVHLAVILMKAGNLVI